MLFELQNEPAVKQSVGMAFTSFAQCSQPALHRLSIHRLEGQHLLERRGKEEKPQMSLLFVMEKIKKLNEQLVFCEDLA